MLTSEACGLTFCKIVCRHSAASLCWLTAEWFMRFNPVYSIHHNIQLLYDRHQCPVDHWTTYHFQSQKPLWCFLFHMLFLSVFQRFSSAPCLWTLILDPTFRKRVIYWITSFGYYQHVYVFYRTREACDLTRGTLNWSRHISLQNAIC